MTTSGLGWLATALFVASYLVKRSATLRKIQASAPCLWIFCGIAISAVPVIVANAIVAGAELYSLFRPIPKEAERVTCSDKS
jgi:hypothetical protein